MLWIKKIGVLALAAVTPIASLAVPIFTITPISTQLEVSQNETAEADFQVRNTSGRSLIITNDTTGSFDSRITTDAVNAADSTCDDRTLASGGDCILAVNVRGNTVGSDTLQPVICAFNGQLCSRPSRTVKVTVVPTGSQACSGATPTCRMFVSTDTFRGNLSQASGTVDVSTCTSNMSSVTRGNCICEQEASSAGYGNPGNWRAWLSAEASASTPEVAAKNNVAYLAATIYTRIDGTVIQNGTTNFLVSNINNNVTLLNSVSNAASRQIWTGTATNGEYARAELTPTTCQHWSSSSTGDFGTFGDLSLTDYQWTGDYQVDNTTFSCNAVLGIYCVERRLS